jgi:hypothetical protein
VSSRRSKVNRQTAGSNSARFLGTGTLDKGTNRNDDPIRQVLGGRDAGNDDVNRNLRPWRAKYRGSGSGSGFLGSHNG